MIKFKNSSLRLLAITHESIGTTVHPIVSFKMVPFVNAMTALYLVTNPFVFS